MKIKKQWCKIIRLLGRNIDKYSMLFDNISYTNRNTENFGTNIKLKYN